MLIRFLLAVTLGLSFHTHAEAEPYAQKQLEAWTDGLLAEMREAGAQSASRGTLSYDPASGKFSVADIKITLPGKVWSSEVKEDGKETKSEGKIEPLTLTISRISADNLMMSGTDWNAARLRVENLRVTVDKERGAFIIPSIDFDTISGPQIAANDLGQTPGQHIAVFLQQAGMKSATIAKMTLTADEKAAKPSYYTFGQIRLENVVSGKAAGATVAPGAGFISAHDIDEEKKADNNKVENVDIKTGAVTMSDLDIGLYADFFLEKPKHAGQKDLPFYSSGTMESSAIKAGASEFTIGAIKTADARINIPEKGLGTLFSLLDEEKLKKLDDEDKRELMQAYGDWMSIVMTGTLESEGFSFKSPDAQMQVKSIAGKEIGATIGELTFADFSLNSSDVKAGFETVNLKKIDTATFTKALAEEMAKNADNPNFKNLEGKLPTFGLVEVNNLSVQSAGEPALNAKRVAFGLEAWEKFLPKKLYFTVEQVTFPADSLAGLEAPNLKDLGYESVTFNSDIQFNYAEATKAAAFAPVKFDFTEAGSLSSELRLKDVDSSKLGDMLEMATQLGTAKFEKLMLQLSNGNFLDRYIAWKAKNEDKSEQAVREELGLSMKMLAIAIPDEAQKKRANEAIEAFVASPKNLTITITPKDKLTLLDLQLGAMANQMGLLNKVNFEITANSGGL